MISVFVKVSTNLDRVRLFDYTLVGESWLAKERYEQEGNVARDGTGRHACNVSPVYGWQPSA